MTPVALDALRGLLPASQVDVDPRSVWKQSHDYYWFSPRLERELGIIEGMGFPGYFLIVADFIQWAKARDIPYQRLTQESSYIQLGHGEPLLEGGYDALRRAAAASPAPLFALGGIPPERITLVIATGTHPVMPPEEYPRILPPEIIERVRRIEIMRVVRRGFRDGFLRLRHLACGQVGHGGQYGHQSVPVFHLEAVSGGSVRGFNPHNCTCCTQSSL